MSELSDTLRLQIAQFNNFLIENYLVKVKSEEDLDEPQAYLFGSFFNLSEHLAALGSTIGSLNDLQPGSLMPLKEAITEAVRVIYLIDEAEDIDELKLTIKGINTANLLSTIKNITAYGKEFAKEQTDIEAEIDELKQDNFDYFNADGTFKFESYHIAFEDAVEYLGNRASVLQVKTAFRKIKDVYQYFSAIISGITTTTNYTGNKIFLGNVLNTLTILLMALGYIEPFFEKPNNVAQFFEQGVREISATQSKVLNEQ